ncbi:hypothetical protein EPUL_005948, partial [Erysiphe pulchra]
KERFDLLGRVDGILLDLGVSSPQLEDPERGFSFTRDGPLDMRMDTTYGLSATKWLAQASVKDITWVLQNFGEERFAKRIAQAIFNQNSKRLITSTRELAELITKIIPFRHKYKHPATRSFQAIRIYINNELNEIQLVLNGALDILATGGKLVVISFHSLEDRLVKSFIRQNSKVPQLPSGISLTENKFPNTLMVVTITHYTRRLTAEREKNMLEQNALDIEWHHLILEGVLKKPQKGAPLKTPGFKTRVSLWGKGAQNSREIP